MKYFKIATLEISKSSYPLLGETVPIYNYLIDMLEDFIDDENYNKDVIDAALKAKDKLQQYYPSSDGLAYVISTSMYKIISMKFK